MSRRSNSKDPLAGAPALVAAGLPAGPLADPQTFWVGSKAGKLHADRECTYLEWHNPKQVDFLTLRADRMCTKCCDGPTSPEAIAYLKHAALVRQARNLLVGLRSQLLAAQSPEPIGTDDPQLAAMAADLSTEPVHVARPTWEVVASANGAQRTLQQVSTDPLVHPAMIEWMHELSAAVDAQVDLLRAAAAEAVADGVEFRARVVDLMGTYSSTSWPEKRNTPDTGSGHLKSPELYPALCWESYGPSQTGYKDLVVDTWRTWRSEVIASGDLDRARMVVHERSRVPQLEPEHGAQFRHLPLGPVEHDTLWGQIVDRWREAADRELDDVVSEWNARYLVELEAARQLPSRIVMLHDWTPNAQRQISATTAVLSQVPLAFLPNQREALAIVDGITLKWLQKFGLRGQVYTGDHSAYSDTGNVLDITAALPGDDEHLLDTASTVWKQPDSTSTVAIAAAMTTAVAVAHGIHAAA